VKRLEDLDLVRRGAEYCFLLVRTDPNSKRHRGISVLLAPMDAPGITVRECPR